MGDLDKDKTVGSLKWRFAIFALLGLDYADKIIIYYRISYKSNWIWVRWIMLGCCIFMCFDSVREIRQIKRNERNK